MRETFATAARWIDLGRECALATLVDLHRAQTAPLGTTMAVDRSGTIIGNIGAGCYEGEIVEAARRTAADGVTRRLDVDLDLDDELLGAAGCGATMRIAVWRPQRAFLPDALAIAAGEHPVELRVGEFVCTVEPMAPLVLVGATALAQALCALARVADFHTTVVDPRPAFATAARLHGANLIVREWPDEFLPRVLDARTAVVVLSHDPKLDTFRRCAARCVRRRRTSACSAAAARRRRAGERCWTAGFPRESLGGCAVRPAWISADGRPPRRRSRFWRRSSRCAADEAPSR